MEKLNINQWAAEDRPREKMMQKGAEALSDAELLAILIGSGNTEETAVTLMQRILAACGNDLATEEFWVLLMNHAAKVIDKVRISRGGIDQTTADVRSILREALLQRATQIALIHNHPSGNPHPSNDEQRLTELVRKAAQTMNIHLTDHVIVTDGSHYSFNDEGLL